MTMVSAGSQRYPNAPMSASPTVMTSSLVTPKEAADIPTCSMKYETSAYPRSMNLDVSVVIEGLQERDILVNFIHRSLAFVGRVIGAPLHGAAGENTKEFVQMGEEEAGKCQTMRVGWNRTTYYWLEVVSLAGMFIMRGAAAPPSRKF